MDKKNIVCFRNDRFGEFLLNIPAFRALKDHYAGSRITLVVSPACADLARCIEYVDDILVWDSKKHSWPNLIKFCLRLRRRRFDLCVVFNPTKEAHLLGFFAGIPTRLGYGRKLGFLLTHMVKDVKALGLKHEVEYNLDLLAALGVHADNKGLSFDLERCPALDTGLAEQLTGLEGGPLIAVHPWTSDAVKQWPLERFAELSKRLATLAGVTLVIIGGEEARTSSLRLFSGMPGQVLNLTGQTTLPQLARLLKKCSLLISGDSGPVHLAACVGTPSLVLFGNDSPAKSPTRWGPWLGQSAVIQNPRLEGITVEEVFSKAKEMLKTR